jgi:hypothetical protein
MGIIHRLMNILPHTEFESPELRDRFTSFMDALDKDMDGSGFDTSSNTDDMFDSLETCINDLENDVILEIREADEEEQEEIDKLTEEMEEKEAEDSATTKVTEEQLLDEEDDEVIDVTLVASVEDGVIKDEEAEEFEQELEEEIAEQNRLDEIAKAATGDVQQDSST